eukprot:scaffold258434_cov37-Tisochrysis_lutea.AAC.1
MRAPLLHGSNVKERYAFGNMSQNTINNWLQQERRLEAGSFATLAVVQNARLFLPRRSHSSEWVATAYNDSIFVGKGRPGDYWRPPTDAERAMPCAQNVSGPVAVWNTWQSDFNYAHFLHDHLPMIYWLRDRIPLQTRVIIGTCVWCAAALRDRTKDFLEWFDPPLAERVEWLAMESMICVDGDLYLAVPHFSQRRAADPSFQTRIAGPYNIQLPSLIARVSHTAMRLHAASKREEDKWPAVVYYSRRSSEIITLQGRIFSSKHDDAIQHAIQSRMKHWLRGERFVVYNGVQTAEYPKPGYPMTAAQQLRLFRSTRLFIGPHGSGLVNVLWMRPAKGSEDGCATPRRHALEFVCGQESAGVQADCPYTRSFYYLLGSAPWVAWHSILYTPQASSSSLKVDLSDLRMAVDSILKELPKESEEFPNVDFHWSMIPGVIGPKLTEDEDESEESAKDVLRERSRYSMMMFLER